MLDQDPDRIRHGATLPRGWHVALFTQPTRQSQLRPDGLASLGVSLPDLGLPRLVNGGRRTRFLADIPVGAAVRRDTRTLSVAPKAGRSGRLAVVVIEHRIFAEDGNTPAIIEEQDFVMLEERPAATGATPPHQPPAQPRPAPQPLHSRIVTPDETMLFRYCAITFNTHRIHYDAPYTTGHEGYPALVVNGGIPVLLLLDLFRDHAGREPGSMAVRNLVPLLCGRPLRLCAVPGNTEWQLWAEDDAGRRAVEARMQ